VREYKKESGRLQGRPDGRKVGRATTSKYRVKALRSLTRYFEMASGSKLMPGVMAAIQTFSDRINLHPHLHLLMTKGGVNQAGIFHKIS